MRSRLSSGRAASLLAAAAAAGLGLCGGVGAASVTSLPTLKATPKLVSYGETVALTGKGSGVVHLLAQPCGFTSAAETAKVTARSGAFKLSLEPAITTTFQVETSAGKSSKVRVSVEPAIALRRVTSRRYAVDVSAGAGSFFAGKHATLQRKSGSAWKTVAKATLRATTSQTALVAVSSATFSGRVPAGAKLRAVMPRSETGACFATATSSVLTAS